MQWSISMRPHTFSDMYGCKNIKSYFYGLRTSGQPYPKAVLFEGIFGGGKTTSAKILAQMIMCTNPKENGDPCCECASCQSIIDETFDMDCKQIDGGQVGKDEVIDIISNFASKPSYRGNHQKVVILEEVQELSTKAKNAILKMLEKPRENFHFIFTSMETLPAGGLKSRCVTFPFKPAGMGDIMYYLKDLLEKTGNWENKDIIGTAGPVEFWGPVIQAVATNASGSYRQATQLIEQCIHCNSFTAEEIRDNTGLVDMNTWYEMLTAVMDGQANDLVLNNLLEGDYQSNFSLAYKVVADAVTYDTFGKIVKQNSYFLAQAKQLASHKNFPLLRDTYMHISENGGKFIAKSDYIIEMCKLIKACQASNSKPTLTKLAEATPVRATRTPVGV